MKKHSELLFYLVGLIVVFSLPARPDWMVAIGIAISVGVLVAVVWAGWREMRASELAPKQKALLDRRLAGYED